MPKGIYKRSLEHNRNISLALSGKKKSAEQINNMKRAMLGVGIGRKHSFESIEKMRQSIPKRELHHNWRGEKANYVTKHQWIHRNFGKADKCENFPIEHAGRKYEYANISGEHLRERSDYKMLCIPCHRKMDKERRANV